MAAELSGVPFLSLVNAYWSPSNQFPMEAPNGGLFRFFPQPIRNVMFSPIRPVAFKIFGNPLLNEVRKKLGLSFLFDYRRQITNGTWSAYLDLPEFYPLQNIPQNHFYLGPVTWNASQAPELKHLFENRESSLVYLTLGGSGDPRPLEKIVRILLSLKCNVVISGVKEETECVLRKKIGNFDKHVCAARFVNPKSILQKSVLTICHGGSGTVYQSLEFGVPVLCFPRNPDQWWVAKALVKTGAGLVLPSDFVTCGAIFGAVKQLLDDEKYKGAAKRIYRLLQNHSTKQHWLKFLGNHFKLPLNNANRSLLKGIPKTNGIGC